MTLFGGVLVLANDKVATVEKNSEGFNPIRFMNEVVAEMKKVSSHWQSS